MAVSVLMFVDVVVVIEMFCMECSHDGNMDWHWHWDMVCKRSFDQAAWSQPIATDWSYNSSSMRRDSDRTSDGTSDRTSNGPSYRTSNGTKAKTSFLSRFCLCLF